MIELIFRLIGAYINFIVLKTVSINNKTGCLMKSSPFLKGFKNEIKTYQRKV